MIKSVQSNNPKFKKVEFKEGFNLILADRTEKKRGHETEQEKQCL
jgi:uncharacterized protein YydD (DUF2326 family)